MFDRSFAPAWRGLFDIRAERLVELWDLRGEAGEDVLNGGDQSDTLEGGADNDRLDGGSGKDALDGGTGDDILIGGGGDDRLLGQAGEDDMSGGEGQDTLKGGDNRDTLNGGGGRDFLFGGSGADTFVYEAVSDSAAGGLNRDRIRDFSEADVIDLSAIDADENTAGDQAFSLVGSFSGAAGEMVWDAGSNLLSLDTDGDGAADMEIDIRGGFTLDETDFIL